LQLQDSWPKRLGPPKLHIAYHVRGSSASTQSSPNRRLAESRSLAMESAQQTPAPGSLSWKLSSHPITLLTFLFFRICTPKSTTTTTPPPNQLTSPPASLLVYLLGLQLLSSNFVLIFIVTILLLAIDFYYLKNIAGRRLVGLRWWNEVDSTTGDGRWVFESADAESREQNVTDKRFFWMALYVQPVLWVVLAVFALIGLKFIWLTLVGEFSDERAGDAAENKANVVQSLPLF
jgi:hypothetical protein